MTTLVGGGAGLEVGTTDCGRDRELAGLLRVGGGSFYCLTRSRGLLVHVLFVLELLIDTTGGVGNLRPESEDPLLDRREEPCDVRPERVRCEIKILVQTEGAASDDLVDLREGEDAYKRAIARLLSSVTFLSMRT